MSQKLERKTLECETIKAIAAANQAENEHLTSQTIPSLAKKLKLAEVESDKTFKDKDSEIKELKKALESERKKNKKLEKCLKQKTQERDQAVKLLCVSERENKDLKSNEKSNVENIEKQSNQISFLRAKAERYRKRFHSLNRTNKRSKKALANLNNIYFALKKRKENPDVLELLENCPKPVAELIKRTNGRKNKDIYPQELKSFAIALHGKSPKCYQYVRKVFNTSLPHVRTIRRWKECMDLDNRFCQDAFDSVQRRCLASNEPVLVNVVVDEMAIKQQVEWCSTRKQWLGFVDIVSGEFSEFLI